MIETECARLSENSAMVGKTIGDLRIRSRTGSSVVAVVGGDEILSNPDPEVAFEASDVVGGRGTPDQWVTFRVLFC
jgi:K+/H+ antiporter YhaU regulatory subunit KhtT